MICATNTVMLLLDLFFTHACLKLKPSSANCDGVFGSFSVAFVGFLVVCGGLLVSFSCKSSDLNIDNSNKSFSIVRSFRANSILALLL